MRYGGRFAAADKRQQRYEFRVRRDVEIMTEVMGEVELQ